MSALRNALILLLAGSTTPALAEKITCESHHAGPEACGTIQPGSSVRLVRQTGDTACVEGRNWGTGAAHDSLWVSQGCSAVFDVQARDNATAATGDDNDENGAGDDRYARRDDRADRDAAMQDERDASAQDDPYAASRDRRIGARGAESRADTRGQAEDDASSDDRYADRRGDQDEEDSRDGRGDANRNDRRDDAARLASGDRGTGAARQACIDEAAAGQSFGPDDVTATDVRRIGHGLLVVELQTPEGDLSCTVDRDGNVRAMDR